MGRGRNPKANLAGAVSKASFIFEKQMNIRLEIATMRLFWKDSKAKKPDYAGECVGSKAVFTKLRQLNKALATGGELQAATHLFTACEQKGVGGVAYLRGACNGK